MPSSRVSERAPLLGDEEAGARAPDALARQTRPLARALRAMAAVAAFAFALACVAAFGSARAGTASSSALGQVPSASAGAPRLPIFFHIEKTGGTSLVLYLLSLLSNTEEEISLVQRSRSEDNIFDAELRASNLLCPGSAMFLTTVFVDNAASFATFPKPLKDSSEVAWRACRLVTSHQGQALQTIIRADMARAGAPERPLVPLGMFRDPVQFEQAAWRSELFMYHDDRKNLGWGTLNDHKFGTVVGKESLADFGDASEFAQTMRDVHCRNNRDNNFQTKKLIDDVWWRFQERMDKGEDAETIHAEAVDIALDRVNALQWVGLTHKYEESACSLAYVLRRHPVDTSGTNYDRGGLISEAFRGNHPHSGSAFEGDMSDALREELYECNAMDTLLVRTAIRRHDEIVAAQLAEIEDAIANGANVPSAGFEAEQLDPEPYKACFVRAGTKVQAQKAAVGSGEMGEDAPDAEQTVAEREAYEQEAAERDAEQAAAEQAAAEQAAAERAAAVQAAVDQAIVQHEEERQTAAEQTEELLAEAERNLAERVAADQKAAEELLAASEQAEAAAAQEAAQNAADHAAADQAAAEQAAQQAAVEQAAAEEAAADQAAAEQAAAEQAAQQAAVEQAAAEQAAADQAAAEQVAAEQAAADQAAAEQVAAEQAAAQAAADQAAADQAAAAQGAADQAAAEQAAAAQAAADQAAAEQAAAEQAAAAQAAAAQAAADQSAAEQSAPDQAAAAQAAADQSAAEQSAPEQVSVEPADAAEQATVDASASAAADSEDVSEERSNAEHYAAEQAAVDQAVAEEAAAEQVASAEQIPPELALLGSKAKPRPARKSRVRN